MLSVTQPTLTVAMRNLEESLGTTLFLRERTGVRLTETGEALLRHATDVMALLARAEESIRGIEHDDIGRFTLGCHESLGAYFLPGFMPEFLRSSHRIDLSLWNGPSAQVTRAVLDREVHFGLVVNGSRHPDLVVVDLFQDEVALFVSTLAELSPTSQRVRLGKKPARMDAERLLRAGPLIFAGRVHQCQWLIDALAKESMLPAKLLPCGDFQLVKSLCVAGVGVAALPARVAAHGDEGKLRRLDPGLPSFPDTISLIYRADMHKTKASQRLKEALVQHGKSLRGGEG